MPPKRNPFDKNLSFSDIQSSLHPDNDSVFDRDLRASVGTEFDNDGQHVRTPMPMLKRERDRAISPPNLRARPAASLPSEDNSSFYEGQASDNTEPGQGADSDEDRRLMPPPSQPARRGTVPSSFLAQIIPSERSRSSVSQRQEQAEAARPSGGTALSLAQLMSSGRPSSQAVNNDPLRSSPPWVGNDLQPECFPLSDNDAPPSSQLLRDRIRSSHGPNDNADVAISESDESIEELFVMPRGLVNYQKALQLRGLVGLVSLAWHHAKAVDPSIVNREVESEWRLQCLYALSSVENTVIEALVNGSLPKAFYAARDNNSDSQFDQKKLAEWEAETEAGAPVIYIYCLVDRQRGCVAPDAEQLARVAAQLRLYPLSRFGHHVNSALGIDNALGHKSTENEVKRAPYFLCQSAKERTVSTAREQTLTAFCDALQRRIDNVPRDARFEEMRPLSYVGYAFNLRIHHSYHDKANESSWLMHLVEHTCQKLFEGQFSFRLESQAVCFLADSLEVRKAELLFAMLANSFASTGGGFNISCPGKSNNSADLAGMLAPEAAAFWQAREDFRARMGFCDKNLTTVANFLDKHDNDAAVANSQVSALERERELNAQLRRERQNKIANLEMKGNRFRQGHRD